MRYVLVFLWITTVSYCLSVCGIDILSQAHAVKAYRYGCSSRCKVRYLLSSSKRRECRRQCYERRKRILDSMLKRVSLSKAQEKAVLAIVKETEARWMDRHGFLRLTPRKGTKRDIDNENPVLFTATYYYLLKRLGMLKGKRKNRYRKKIRTMLAKLRLEPGLFNRYPSIGKKKAHPRHFSRDEQIGLGTFDIAFDRSLGLFKELCEYGKRNSFFYENRTWLRPGKHQSKKSVRRLDGFRQHNFRGYVCKGAGESMGLLARKWTMTALALTRRRSKQKTSGKILAYLRFEVLRHSASDIRDAITKFHLKMQQMYGKIPLQGLFRIYYRHPQHPIRKLVLFLK